MKNFFKGILGSRLLSTIVIIVVLVLLFGWGVSKYMGLQTDLRISEQNVSALKDSLRVSKNKVGTLEFSKQILVAKNAADLKELNEDLAKQLKNFSGKIHELTKIVAEIKNDTIIIDNTQVVDLPDGEKGFQWSYDKVFDTENSRSLAGMTKFKFDADSNLFTPLETIITKDDIKFNIVQGLRTTKDGKVEMFVSSDYPNFAAKELNSAIIDPSTHPALKKFSKQKRLFIGLYTGFGGTLNLSNSTVIAGPQIGIGGMYRLW